jgi:hypothetical protein
MNEAETVTLEVPTQPIPVPPAPQETPKEFSGKPGDLMADLALLQAQQNQVPSTPEPVQAVEPEQPATASTTPVPDKFKNPDGTMNEARVQKSVLHGEAALARALEVEKQLRMKQNEIAALQKGLPVQATPASVPANVQLSPLEIQVAQDLINEAAALGEKMSQAYAIAQARVQVRMMEAKHSAEASLTEQLRHRIEDQDRRRELEAIAKEDSSVFSPEGIEALSKIRMENPWVNQSPNPWQTAYDLHLAQKTRQERLNGTVSPTPTGMTAKAPPTPVNPAPRAVVQPTGPDLSSKEKIDAHVASLDEKGMKEFYGKFGLKFR